MITLINEHAIIQLKLNGWSNRKIATELDIDRKTVARYWNRYLDIRKRMDSSVSLQEVRELTEEITRKPAYNSNGRKRRKYNAEIDELLDRILEDEKKKSEILGPGHKQSLTGTQIHQMIVDEGFDIGISTIRAAIKEKRHEAEEAYIRQEYDPGDRFEYDFGEVRLIINGRKEKVYMAVITSPASGYRVAYLYRSQKMDVFLDSHVRFFEDVGGVYKEGVYDNMRNVVARFIGRNGKELNPELIRLSRYYGFIVNVTNCFSGNEKGSVESSVKWVRNRVFAIRYTFDSFEEAEEYLEEKLKKMNEKSIIDEEKKHLLPYRHPYETAVIHTCHVSKYSFIQLDNCFYSVEDTLVDRYVTIKEYPNEIIGYYKGHEICRHRKSAEKNRTCIDIRHYLRTFTSKPGAVKNSSALRGIPELKELFDTHFISKEKRFIEILQKYRNCTTEEIIERVRDEIDITRQKPACSEQNWVEDRVDEQIVKLSELFTGGAANVDQ